MVERQVHHIFKIKILDNKKKVVICVHFIPLKLSDCFQKTKNSKKIIKFRTLTKPCFPKRDETNPI